VVWVSGSICMQEKSMVLRRRPCEGNYCVISSLGSHNRTIGEIVHFKIHLVAVDF
jgi:hypothetical protein